MATLSSTSSLIRLCNSASRPSFTSCEAKIKDASLLLNICSAQELQKNNTPIYQLYHKEASVSLDYFITAEPAHQKGKQKCSINLVPTASSLLLNESEDDSDYLSSEYNKKCYPIALRIRPVVDKVFQDPNNHFSWQRMVITLIVTLKVDNVLEIAVNMIYNMSLRFPAMTKWFFVKALIGVDGNCTEEENTNSSSNTPYSSQPFNGMEGRDDSNTYPPLQTIGDTSETRSPNEGPTLQTNALELQKLASSEVNKDLSLIPALSKEHDENDVEDEWGHFTDLDEEPSSQDSLENALLADPFNSLKRSAVCQSGMKASLRIMKNLVEEDHHDEYSVTDGIETTLSFDALFNFQN
uniref:Uncharacterized protein n=1 Tax=Ditylum brightwellii TaxID=49249 RepID=A0A7S2E784_9STRA|mmetsp:Transcript_17497/g.26051  ORF Transcript_17497/g.26051 Transcript_17497/m.26051 type:complete len:353 (+) Transcript_17497:197-1255(+)